MQFDADMFLVLGIVITVLAIPAVLGAILERRRPRLAVLTILIGGAMIGYAVTQRPGTYRFETLPDVFLRVVSNLL